MITDQIIKQAYENIYKRLQVFPDSIAADIGLSAAFIKECYLLAGQSDPFKLPKKLIGLRKAGKLPTYKKAGVNTDLF